MYSSITEQRRSAQVQALADRLYAERREYLLHIARRNGANGEDAEEALQDSFVLFINHFDPESDSPPFAWLTFYADLCVMPTLPRKPAPQAEIVPMRSA